MDKQNTVTVTKEMAVTPDEFHKMLIASLGKEAVTRQATTITVQTRYGDVQIALTPLPPRIIAMLQLPLTQVVFDYSGWAADLIETQKQWFDLHLRRGGG